MENITWDDAVAFCTKLTERERTVGRLPEGYVYRLPTEAEWEYAARGHNKSGGYIYSGSNNLDMVGWSKDNSSRTQSVAQKSSNELGLYDMSGNVWEWCQDRYGPYPSGSVTDPVGPSSGSYRVIRGGCWDGNAVSCRVSYRFNLTPLHTSYYYGLRVVLALPVEYPSELSVMEPADEVAEPANVPPVMLDESDFQSGTPWIIPMALR